jgi:hypothetical protein
LIKFWWGKFPLVVAIDTSSFIDFIFPLPNPTKSSIISTKFTHFLKNQTNFRICWKVLFSEKGKKIVFTRKIAKTGKK